MRNNETGSDKTGVEFDAIPTAELTQMFDALMQMLPRAWEAERRGTLTADIASNAVAEPALIEFTTDIWRSAGDGIRGEEDTVSVRTTMPAERAELAIAAIERLVAVVPVDLESEQAAPGSDAARAILNSFLASARRTLRRARGEASLETGTDEPPVI